GATVSGSVTPGTVNADPVMLIAVITRFAVPVFVTVTVFELLLPTVADPNDNEFGETDAETVGPDPGSCGFGVVDTPVLPHPVMTGNANRTTMAQACAAFIAIEFAGFVTVPSSPLPSSEHKQPDAGLPCSHGKGRRVQVQSKWAFETVRKTTVDPVLLATALRGDGTGHLGRCPNERIKSSTGQQDARNPAKTRFHVAIQRCPESRLPPAGAAAQGRSCKFSMPNNGTTIPTVATVLLGPSFLNSAVPAGSVTCILALQVPLQFSRIGRKLLEK